MNWTQQRTMTKDQYAAAIAKLGMNQQQAGRFLDLSKNTAHRYAKGLTVVPAPIAMLLNGMLERGERAPEDV